MELAFYEFLIWISKMSPVDKRLPMMHMWEDMRLIITSYIEEFEEV
jgi:hypothetical protein